MLTTPFLTDLDSRAAVKGSRDPLGIQPIWTRLGRHVVGNLTTVSNSARDFTTLLLGYYFAELLAEELGPGTELATFLKWEQLAAYARAAKNKDWAFRGTERVRKNLSEGSRITLSDGRAHQILGNQKIYGLWGLYTVPARTSGLLDGDPARLNPSAREFVQDVYVPILEDGSGKNARRIVDLLRRSSSPIDVASAEAAIVDSIARILRRQFLAKERVFYREHILHGGTKDETDGRQAKLASLLEGTLSQREFAWSPAQVGSLVKQARSRGEAWHPLADRLLRIQVCESVLAPTSVLFTHLLGLEGKTLDATTKRIREAWGSRLSTIDVEAFTELRGEIAAGDATTGERWIGIARALAAGQYRELVDLLLAQNKSVMTTRGGAPWIELRDQKLNVRFQDEQGDIPDREEIAQLWRFPYFLDSLRTVAAALKEP